MRDPKLQEFVDGFAKNAFGRTQTEAKTKCVCVICGHPATQFRDRLSAREYEISGMCQKCQDKTFGK